MIKALACVKPELRIIASSHYRLTVAIVVQQTIGFIVLY